MVVTADAVAPSAAEAKPGFGVAIRGGRVLAVAPAAELDAVTGPDTVVEHRAGLLLRALSAPDMANMVGYTRTAYPAGTTLQPVPGGVNGTGAPGSSSPRWGDYELLWAYHHTTKMSAFTATGQRVFDERLAVGKGSLATTVVTYPSHTWWTAQSPRPAVTGSASAGCLPAGQIRLTGGANAWPAFIHSQLACGAYTVAGKQALGSVDALRITGSSGQFTLWVNPVTYLPMRLQEGGLIRINFQWLPPTPANLAMLNLAVPASFHQVVPPS
jgi:hypothetical protein